MRHPHVTSGGRYPALRTIAVLYLIGAVVVAGMFVWQAIRVVAWGGDEMTYTWFGPAAGVGGKVLGAACWLASGFVGLLLMFAVAELIKLFIDIEQNTRAMAHAATASTKVVQTVPTADGDVAVAAKSTNGDGSFVHEGPAVPFLRDRKLFEGEETAEGALLRGH